MLENFAFAFNAVMPILLLMLLGYCLKLQGLFNSDTMKRMNTFVFRYGLSIMMFCNVYSLDDLSDIPVDLMVFALGSIMIITVLYLGVAMFATDRHNRRGVIVQTGFRSNFAVIGAALASAMCGAEGSLMATGIQAPGIIYFNIAAVLLLTTFSDSHDHTISIKTIFKRIATNSLILGLFGGVVCLVLREFIPRTADGALVFSLSGTFPFLYSAMESLAAMATPLVLVITGAQVDFRAASGMKKEIIVGVVLRLIVTPILGFAMAFGAQNMGLLTVTPAVASALLAFYGSPVAVAGAVMADSMHCDGELARQHVVWTNTISMGTLFVWIVLFRTVGLV